MVPLLVIVGSLFIVFAHVLVAAHSGVLFGSPLLVDTDAFMWLNRVNHLVGDGGWFDKVYPRINPPQGHVQHWTRPTDLLLLAGARPLGALIGFDRALYLWSVVLPPVLHLVTYWVLLAALLELVRAGILSRDKLPLASLLILAQVPLYMPFLAGRPDHHALLAVAFAVHILIWLRILLGNARSHFPGVALGLISSFAVWLNPESLIYLATSMAGMTAVWIASPHLFPRGILSGYGASLAGGGLLCGIAEWGWDIGSANWMDVLSLPHIVLFLFVGLYWVVLEGRSPLVTSHVRLWTAAAGAAGVLTPVLLMFPEFVSDPLAATDPVYRVTRLERIEELQSIWSPGSSLPGRIGPLLLFAGIPLMALFYLVGGLKAARRIDLRLLTGTALIGVATYLFLSLLQRRWVDYLAIASTLPAGLLAAHALTRVEARFRNHRWRKPLRLSAVLAVVTGPMLLGLGLQALEPDPQPSSASSELQDYWRAGASGPQASIDNPMTCDTHRMTEALNNPDLVPGTTLVLAHTDLGPEILYRTSHSVLSIPNHRPQPGYHFMRGIVNSNDLSGAGHKLVDRGVGVVVLCLSDVTSGFWGEGPESVAWRLVQGEELPGFSRAVEIDGLRVYVLADLVTTTEPPV